MSVWTFGGTALSTFGIVTQINDYLDIPERRSDNQLIPFRDGRVYVRKYYEQRVLDFGITLNKADLATLEASIDTMRKLLSPRTEQTLSVTLGDASVRNALASVNESMSVKRLAPGVAKILVEFTLADPFFRGSALTTNTTTINASPKAYNITNPGTADDRSAVITLTGPLNYPKITNVTNSVWVGYNGVIGSGNTVVINVANFTALYGATNVIGSVVHSGDPHFMVLMPGVNSLSVTDLTHTTGTVKIEFYAPFY